VDSLRKWNLRQKTAKMETGAVTRAFDPQSREPGFERVLSIGMFHSLYVVPVHSAVNGYSERHE